MKEKVREYRFPAISKKDMELPFLAVTVGKEEQQKIYRPNGIEHHQFLFTVSGSGKAVINGKKILADSGTLMYHAPNSMQYYYPVTEKWNVCWITFLQAFNLFSAKSGVYQMGDVSNFKIMIDEILAIESSFLYSEQVSVILYKMILEVNRRIENFKYNESSHKLQAAMDYINRLFYRDIELEDLSSVCGLSEEYFCRLFKKTYGLTAFSYIRNLRIQEAKKRLLLYKKQSLSQIAESVGYHSVNYFVTDFKRREKITPSEFRHIHQSAESDVLDDMV